MIVNFYERNSETLNKYRMPEPHRSTIDYRMYLSDGYIVFNPDVRYRDGYPGESCYNCVMSGVYEVLSRGYAMAQTEDGCLIRSISDVRPQEQITVSLTDGNFTATVNEVKERAQ